MNFRALLSLFAVMTLVAACGSPAVPFDTLKNSNVVVYRLNWGQQNVPPPAQAAPPPQAMPGLPMIPGLPIPPEVTAMAQQAGPLLQQWILGAMGQPAAPGAAPPPAPTRMYHGFGIIGERPVMNPEFKEHLGEIFGTEDNFEAQRSHCFYPEFGMSFFSGQGAPPKDLLISLSCGMVQAHGFMWPHSQTGLTSAAGAELMEMIPQLFPGAPAPHPVASAGGMTVARL